MRLERIVSEGHATPGGEWFDQEWDEWVILLSGSATLRFNTGVGDIKEVSADFYRGHATLEGAEFGVTAFYNEERVQFDEGLGVSRLHLALRKSQVLFQGQELRLKQQYFFVSCSIQDIIRRFLVKNRAFDRFPQPPEQRDVQALEVEWRRKLCDLAVEPGKRLPFHRGQAIPLGSDALPSRALGAAGGGQIAVEAKDGNGLTAVERVFQVDL
ncbi:MAG: hypothetical protein HGB11_06455, partial [Chlorobiales bacterium]|nr:hypothetical protein [Chlorobiales bacterium]